jgi:glycosyltransferase involved in cell wall biosynthesis
VNNKIKVLHVCAVGTTVEKLLLPLIDEMSRNYDVISVCSRDEVSDRLAEKGYKIKNIKIDRKLTFFGNLRSLLSLYRFMKREKFHIVHAHTPVAGVLGRVAAWLAGVPIIIYTAHGFYFHENMPVLKRLFFMWAEKIAGYLTDYVFTQSTEDYNTAISRKIISKSKIMAIGNGVDIEKFDINRVTREGKRCCVKEEFKIRDGEIVVGIVGRIVREKGYMEWVRAARMVLEKYKNVKFLAVGDALETDRDGIKNELDIYIAKNNLKDKVIFVGNRDDIPELLLIFDIFAFPSHREGMPRSLIEAMSMSIPSVASDIRGCREEVENGVTGFLVPPGDYKSLAEKIMLLIENPELRREMGLRARQKVEKEFDENMVIQKQMKVIKELIRGSGLL